MGGSQQRPIIVHSRHVLSKSPRLQSLAFGVVAGVTASPAFAQSAENVMVVINEANPDSVQIGEHYVAKRKIPAENIVRLRTVLADDIDRAAVRVLDRAADLGDPHPERDSGPDSLHRPDEGRSAQGAWIGWARRQRRERRFRIDAALPQAYRCSDSTGRAKCRTPTFSATGRLPRPGGSSIARTTSIW